MVLDPLLPVFTQSLRTMLLKPTPSQQSKAWNDEKNQMGSGCVLYVAKKICFTPKPILTAALRLI